MNQGGGTFGQCVRNPELGGGVASANGRTFPLPTALEPFQSPELYLIALLPPHRDFNGVWRVS